MLSMSPDVCLTDSVAKQVAKASGAWSAYHACKQFFENVCSRLCPMHVAVTRGSLKLVMDLVNAYGKRLEESIKMTRQHHIDGTLAFVDAAAKAAEAFKEHAAFCGPVVDDGMLFDLYQCMASADGFAFIAAFELADEAFDDLAHVLNQLPCNIEVDDIAQGKACLQQCRFLHGTFTIVQLLHRPLELGETVESLKALALESMDEADAPAHMLACLAPAVD